MKVTGAPPPPVSPQGIASGTGRTGADGGNTTVQSIHLDTARHGVDAAHFVQEMRSSPGLAQMRAGRQTGVTELRNSMIRSFGSDLVEPLFNENHGNGSSGRKP